MATPTTYKAPYTDFEDVGIYIGDTGKIFDSPAKKLKNVYHLLYTNANLLHSQFTAQKGKGDREEINSFNRNILENLQILYELLSEEKYIPGEYKIRKIFEPKERDLMIAPFFPDRIIHHCIINVLGRFWTSQFISNTYACIKGRGVHKCLEDMHEALIMDNSGTRYCLKIDIRKFYDNIDHAALKVIIRYRIADERLLRLLDKIIDSNGKEKGLPIGNYTSQYLANLYLAYFDHWVKETLVKIVERKFGCKFYFFRYMDDMVFLCADKVALHFVLDMVGLYLGAELKVEIKPNWQIFPVDARSIDYVGFKTNHYGILLRKGILKRFYAKYKKIHRQYEINDVDAFKHLFPSEYGWIIRCSEEHSKFIFNNCIKNGKGCINYKAAG